MGFTIVWPEGVIFGAIMTYHVQFLLLVLAGWVNRQQQDVIDYLREENRVLRAGLRGKRLRLSDDDRRSLAVKAQALGREVLAEIASVATPRRVQKHKRTLRPARREVSEFIYLNHGERNYQELGNAFVFLDTTRVRKNLVLMAVCPSIRDLLFADHNPVVWQQSYWSSSLTASVSPSSSMKTFVAKWPVSVM